MLGRARQALAKATLGSKWTKRGLAAVAVAVPLSLATADPQTVEGLSRSLQFWAICGPIYMHYRFMQWRLKNADSAYADKQWNRLHDRYAPIIERHTIRLKGFYLKNAQICSTRDDFVPPQYLAFCKRMQDQVPVPFLPGEAKKVVADALGVDSVDRIFDQWQDEPLGAASIGAVYKARIRATGKVVAVKVMYPGIERRFRCDLRTTISFCRMFMPHHVPPLLELEKNFEAEFDYVAEAQSMQIIHDNVIPVFGDRIVIPEPVPALCRRNVLVMDFIPGVRLIDGINANYSKYAAQKGMTLDQLVQDQKDKIARGIIQMRTVDEEAAYMRRMALLVNARNVMYNSFRALFNWTLGWFFGCFDYEWEDPPLNLGYIIRLLNHVHAHEIFICGFFNGDPHPGNILLCPDGRLALLDYGQVKQLSLDSRILYARLILALASGSVDDIVRVFRQCGFKSRYNKAEIQYRLACFWNDRDTEEITGGRNIQDFMDWAEAQDPMVDVPRDHVYSARVSVLLRGMANAFHMKLRTAPIWADKAREFLVSQNALTE